MFGLNRIPILVCYHRPMTEPNDTPVVRARRGLHKTAARAGAGAYAVIRMAKLVMPFVRIARAILWRLLEALIAVVIVFEEWGWRPLAAFLAGLAKFGPIARIEALISRLPPYPALAVFALPGLLLLPVKLLALAWIAAGHVVWATLLFIFAKVVGTAVVARIFQLTQPALMQLGWFVKLHDTIMPWKHAVVERVRASRTWRIGRVVKSRAKHAIHRVWLQYKPLAEPYVARVRQMLRLR